MAGSCDSHCHIVGPASRFPLRGQVDPASQSQEYPKELLAEVQARLGLERAVIVQSARHGTDNSVVEDAVRTSNGRYVGIAVVPPTVADSELERLAAAGIRGVRFNFMHHLTGGAPIEAVMALASRLGRFELHLQVHFESDLIHVLAPHLRCSPVPVVIDHMGRVDASKGADQADFVALRALLADDRFLVKVSGIDRIDPDPPHRAGVALAQLLVENFPDRCLWGTDWPHLNHRQVPDDQKLVGLIDTIAPDPDLRRKLMVRNPERFYRFVPRGEFKETQ